LTTPAHSHPYQTGTVYTAAVDLKVRAGAGTAFRQKKTSELTADGRKHAYERADAVLKSGTRITVQEVKTVNGDIWLKIPSGWIAGCYQGKTYVK
ncbi:MAG: hypothetical protein LIO46_01500, partial [Clostridiales bacterium]|nr:hypothetical protein [Clostridiales bacterium]